MVIALVGITMQIVTAFFIVKVSVAVLEEKLRGHRAEVELKLDAHTKDIGTVSKEIDRIRDWKHDELTPRLQKHENSIRTLEGRTHE